MPELPEVETIRRQLAPVVEGGLIDQVEVTDARWVAPASVKAFEKKLVGRRVLRLGRRGKYFVAELDDGSALVMHLRMTGNLLYIPEGDPVPEAHLRGQIWLASGGSLAFTDPRRFGTAELISTPDALQDYLGARLGPEPFDEFFDGPYLYTRTHGRKTPIKAVLLDQRVVAGVGNIYADEALFRARVAPQRRAARVTRAQAELLTETVQDALNAGIDAKGASIDDFRDAYGVKGSFQDQFLVHRREGLPCPECDTPVKKIRCAGRGTYYCPACQKN
ncbi:MAG: bifunctional DNA-formamidopyrimidine glycosylase/DNA-(apurinic or apyrimidinic site) lyase [Thermoleophilaceae bacterium]|nr:bifunctional DNA-formamidopyrimidine glycosylase/DNA-(apurinic or apyrimidinic site) lyase [Thermoleophilaceae bacterium]